MTLHVPNLNDLADIAPPTPIAHTGSEAPRGVYRNGIKRGLDTLLILLALPFVLPLVLFTTLFVASDGHRPFFTQTRIGRDGRRFRMWKLRTMVPDAEAHLRAYLADHPTARAEWDSTQKLKNDPRITRMGKFLRKSSIDELPQLWNVLNGSMSLVGPRPMMLDQQALYHGTRYYNLRPGITGFWQVSDRNESHFSERVQHDDAYDKQISLKTDISTLWRTVSVILKCTGY
jgi:lipopolysaccharide/colanic/teichoic acid biosynthesis glycosyltransferase